MAKTVAKKLVAIGGGGGVSPLLLGARPYFTTLTAVIAVTDSGRSTGTARALADIPAPGDLRNALATLAAAPDSLWPRLLQHRFHSAAVPTLDGMAFGNLLLAALAELTGDFGGAVETVAGLTEPLAHVLPISTVNARLCAELEDGTTRMDELAVRGLNKPPIRRLTLDPPDAPAHPPVLQAIAEADLVALGPGSFYTSLLASLLFAGVVESLRETRARVVFICNSTTQPGQTDGMTALNHVQRLVELLGPGVLDVVLINRTPDLDEALLADYAAEGLHMLRPDDAEIEAIAALGVTPEVRDFGPQLGQRRAQWNKQDTIRFDAARLGAALAELAAQPT
ncbi:MAG: YvcK family protein [Chloroflexaceae bacterium]|nr:YvcK family protein [Chloroflexaceae bacterium]